MAAGYDIRPTDRLPGLHLRGTVTRRFLISYPVPPEALTRFLPPGAELSTWGGCGWVSACFVNIRDMRPSFPPQPLGLEFNYLIHRTRARLPFPDGTLREAVLILEPNINRRLFASSSRMTTGIQFQVRDIRLVEDPDGWTLTMHHGPQLLFEARIERASISASLPDGSLFADAAAADEALLGVSWGGQWHADSKRLWLIAETHEPWRTLTATCETPCNTFLEALHGEAAPADHVITMTGIPHYFALRGVEVALTADLTLAAAHEPARNSQ